MPPRPPDQISKLTWVYISGAVFAVLFAAVIAFILTAQRFSIPNGLYYLLLIILGLGGAGFLFGALRSYAKFKGEKPGGTLELGGPVVFVLLVVIGGYYFNKPGTFALTVRVHGPGGPADIIREGRLIADLAGVRRNAAIGTDGEVVFGDVPAELDGQPVRLIPEVSGFEPASAEPSVIPESHIIELGLARKIYATQIRGTLRDRTGRLVRNAELSFDGGTVTATSDAAGNFKATIPAAPGTVVSLTITVNGQVVYNQSLTVSAEPPLQLVIERPRP